MEKNQSYLSFGEMETIRLWTEQIEANANVIWSNLMIPFSVIGIGSNRVVYDIGNGLVLKVAISKKGIKHNEIEAKIYRNVPSSLKKYLAKVIDQGYGWIIMKKMNNKVPHTKKHSKIVVTIYNKFTEVGIKPRDIKKKNKPKWKNIGLNEEGQITIIDYGDFQIFKK